MSTVIFSEVVSDKKLGVTTVSIDLHVGKHGFVRATGASKLHSPDVYNPGIGEALATARALREAANKLEKKTRNELDRQEKHRLNQEARELDRKKEKEARAVLNRINASLDVVFAPSPASGGES